MNEEEFESSEVLEEQDENLDSAEDNSSDVGNQPDVQPESPGEDSKPEIVSVVLVVENGEGVENANSYVSVEFADDYCHSRGMATWEECGAEDKKRALIRATDFIDNMFRWYGKKLYSEQALRFPRQNLVDYEGCEVTGVPLSIKQCVCDAAVLSASGVELFQTEDANGDVVSERIGELSFTYSKRNDGNIKGITLYDSINTRLRGLYKDPDVKTIVSGKVARV